MEKYKVNFLTNVIVRVDIAPILSIGKDTPASFQELIREMLPRIERKQSLEVIVDGDSVKQHSKMNQWQFASLDRKKIATADINSITYEVTVYSDYSSFRSEMTKVLGAFGNVYKPGLVKRIGLRYINQIGLTGDPYDWEGYIDARLTSGMSFGKSEVFGVSRLMSQMHLLSDECMILFQYGAYNKEFPNKISKKSFVLDYDCSTRDEGDYSSVVSTVDKYNEIVYSFFESSIGDRLRQTMREVPA